jgi:hypothetical protein
VVWPLTASKIFNKSVYYLLEKNLSGAHNKGILNSKLDLIFFSMWQPHQDAVVTRENLRKRKCLGSPKCSFCGSIDISNHLFFSSCVSNVVWGTLGACMGASSCHRNFGLAWLYAITGIAIFLTIHFYYF